MFVLFNGRYTLSTSLLFTVILIFNPAFGCHRLMKKQSINQSIRDNGFQLTRGTVDIPASVVRLLFSFYQSNAVAQICSILQYPSVADFRRCRALVFSDFYCYRLTSWIRRSSRRRAIRVPVPRRRALFLPVYICVAVRRRRALRRPTGLPICRSNCRRSAAARR